MTTSAMAKVTKDYFQTLLAATPDVLNPLLRRSEHPVVEVRITEHIIQDYLAAVFQPFAGRWRVPEYIQIQAPQTFKEMKTAADAVIGARVRFGLIGAHYRSALSTKGRRSAFSIHQSTLLTSLRRLLPEFHGDEHWLGTGGRRVLETLWETVYLEQYFGLFDRKLTLGEWAFDQKKKIPMLILSAGSIAPRILQQFRDEIGFKQIVTLQKSFTDTLLSDDLLRDFARGVARGIAGALAERKDGIARHLARQFEGAPDAAGLATWNDLVRSANALARHAILQSAVEGELELRHSYVTGMLLFDAAGGALRHELLKFFHASAAPHSEEHLPKEMERLSRLLRVFQSLQFYSRRYGENCATLPYNPGTKGGEESQSSITLFWDGARNLEVLSAMAAGARGLFGQLRSLVKDLPRDRPPSEAFEPEDEEVVKHLYAVSKGRVAGIEVHVVLRAARDLSRALHEGKPRSFSFILGSPELLISDLSVVHDLMGSSRRYLSAEASERRFSYERTLAFLRGNSAFFQDDSLALFLPYPGLPLEVTHVVRITRDGVGRRQRLSAFLKGKPAALGVVTYGSGAGEIIYNGEANAVLSATGRWVHTNGFKALVDLLEAAIGRLESAGLAKKVVDRLEPCLRRISEEPGVGGLFVIARESDALRRLKKSSIPLTEVIEPIDGRSLSELDPRDVYDLARDDGATIVELPSLRVWGRRLLATGSRRGAKRPADDSPETPREPVQSLEWGTRRWTAQRVSQNLADDGVVVVVSADGPICLLQRGEPLARFGERDPFPQRRADPPHHPAMGPREPHP